MPTIRLSPFGGMRPAISSPLREARHADIACNTKLLTGALKPLRAPLLVKEGEFKSIVHFPKTQNGKLCGVKCLEECAWVFPDNTTVCSGFDTAVKFYHRSEGKKPERIRLDTCETFPLCIEPPQGTLSIQIMDAGNTDQPDIRIYTYTFVDQFGIESAPALAGEAVTLGDDGSVRLTGFDTPPEGAACIRIYRTSSPFDTGEDNNVSNETTFQLVEEIPAEGFSGFYIDELRLGEISLGTLDTMDHCCPPEFCEVVMTESGYFVGFADNRIWVSERHQPHTFPLDNMLELPDMIVGLAAHRDTVLVGTVGKPYRVTISTQPEGDVVEAEAFPEHLPMVNPNTMVETPWGAMYASNIGLVGLFPSRNPVVLSRERITEDQWTEYIPCAAGWHRGRYYGFRKNGKSFAFDVAEGGESRLEIGDFYLIDFNASYAMSVSDGSMYLINDEGVWDWENGTEFLEYRWLSKEFIVHPSGALNAANIIADGDLRLKIWCDGVKVCDGEVDLCRPYRLGKLPRGRRWQLELCGTACVDELILSSSIGEAAQVRN